MGKIRSLGLRKKIKVYILELSNLSFGYNAHESLLLQKIVNDLLLLDDQKVVNDESTVMTWKDICKKLFCCNLSLFNLIDSSWKEIIPLEKQEQTILGKSISFKEIFGDKRNWNGSRNNCKLLNVFFQRLQEESQA